MEDDGIPRSRDLIEHHLAGFLTTDFQNAVSFQNRIRYNRYPGFQGKQEIVCLIFHCAEYNEKEELVSKWMATVQA